MPQYKLPHNLSDSPSEYSTPEEKAEAIANLAENFEDLVRQYNKVLSDLDAEVFYHIIPIATKAGVVAVGTFTPSHKIKVLLPDATGIPTEYYIQLDAV